MLAIGLSAGWSTQGSSPFTIDMGRKSTRHPSALSLKLVYQTPEDDCRCPISDFGPLPSYWPLSLCVHRLARWRRNPSGCCSCIHSGGILHRTTRSWPRFVRNWRKGSSEPLAVYDASLDAEQVSESDDPQPLLELLRHRFAGSPPDVVVTIGPPAAAFYLKNRDKVFPGTPVVISALDERFVHKSALRAGDAVVAIHQHLPGLVDNILRVLPDTQTIAVVIGDSPLERFWLGEARKEFAQFANRVSIEWLNNLSLEQMRQRVAALPPHSAVLYITDGDRCCRRAAATGGCARKPG